jgi:superfamily II DNA or RNA helicase
MTTRTLRDYQVRVNDDTKEFLMSDKARGQIFAPTGAGKTECFFDIINWYLTTARAIGKEPKFSNWRICIVYPRLALSKQQLVRAKSGIGVAAVYTSFNSAKHPVKSGDICTETNTTSPTTLVDLMEMANDQYNSPHITFASYQSFGRCVNVNADVYFDLVIFDECHYLQTDTYYNWLPNVNAAKILQYTATPVTREIVPHDTEGNLINIDPDRFGGIVSRIRPFDLVKRGFIVPPRIDLVKITTESDASEKWRRLDAVRAVAECFVNLYLDNLQTGLPYTHNMVATRNVGMESGVGDIAVINANGNEIKRLINEILVSKGYPEISGKDLDIYTVHANGADVVGGHSMTKEEAVGRVSEAKKHVIIAHFNTLSEGVDIPTISGVTLLRNMTTSLLIQNCGRSLRPHVDDLLNGNPDTSKFDPLNGIDTRIKPHAVIMVPVIDGDANTSQFVWNVMQAFTLYDYEDIVTVKNVDDRVASERPLIEVAPDHRPIKILHAEAESRYISWIEEMKKMTEQLKKEAMEVS